MAIKPIKLGYRLCAILPAPVALGATALGLRDARLLALSGTLPKDIAVERLVYGSVCQTEGLSGSQLSQRNLQRI